jgi:uncharacterized membrane protein
MDSVDSNVVVSCPDCAAQMPDTAAFCPSCGKPAPLELATETMSAVGGLPQSLAGGLAYLTFIPAIIFLLVEPYKKNRFVRFHSNQCLLFWAVLLIAAALLRLLAVAMVFIPVAGPLFMVVIVVVASLAAFFTWLVLVVKALRGELFKLPVLGDVAERYARSG